MLSDKQFLYVAMAALVGGYILYSKKGDLVSAINPASPDNIVSKSVNSIGDSLDDGEDNNSFSLGSWIYDITHPDELDFLTPNQLPERN